MRRSPPLMISVQALPALRGVAAVWSAVVVASLVAWLSGHDARALFLIVLVPAAFVWAWREASVQPAVLRWDGERWWLSASGEPEEVPVRLRVLFDFDRWLLLRACPSASVIWDLRDRRYLPLTARRLGSSWGALRATLYSAHQV